MRRPSNWGESVQMVMATSFYVMLMLFTTIHSKKIRSRAEGGRITSSYIRIASFALMIGGVCSTTCLIAMWQYYLLLNPNEWGVVLGIFVYMLLLAFIGIVVSRALRVLVPPPTRNSQDQT
jgi:uncharacterized membrane protein (UPF0136 family)